MVKCPVCGERNFEEDNNFEVCDVCGWENDGVQLDDPDYRGGANEKSLNERRTAWERGKFAYVARVSHCSDGVCISFPDVPGVLTYGDTREEALSMAKDALECWFMDGTPLPAARRIEELEQIPDIRHDNVYSDIERRYKLVEVAASLDGRAHDKGLHEKYEHPDGRKMIVPTHGGDRTLPAGVLNGIKRIYEGNT
jgi:predicted RNase H-like HicB family nuclease